MLTKIYRVTDLAELTGLSRGTIHNLIAQGKIPRPSRLYEGARSVGWSEQTISEWLDTRLLNSPSNDPTAEV